MKNKSAKQKKLFIGLIISAVIFIILGLLFTAIISKENKELVTTTITNFMTQVKNNKLNYNQAILESILKNGLEASLIFFLGMSIIGIPITLFFYLGHAFTLGFSISTIFYVYKWKGFLLAFIYILPQLLNLFIFLILSYYSLLFSKYLFYHLFLKKDIAFKTLMKRYVKVFGISIGLLLVSSGVEVFLIPKLLSFVI